MSGRIPKEFIAQLMDRIDIVDVIDARVPLRKAGRDYKACCPFHEEKTPSFTVSAEKQFYHCFGCQAHGTAIGFLMDYDHMGFVEAVEELAARAGMAVPYEAGGGAPSIDLGLYGILDEAASYYRRMLREHPAAPQAVAYLQERGLSGDIANRFGIGFAPPGWDNALLSLGTTPQRRDDLLRLGLLVRNDAGRIYDRFRSRIMFPIRDYRGRVVAFGGRVLDDAKPKYLNSPESEVFHKGRELYGLYEATHGQGRRASLLVVEGYMDVVALAQQGIDSAVATLGTATTRDHLERIFRTTGAVVFCFDGDRAGRQAGWRALEMALPALREGHQASFLFLPEGEDPDTLVRKEGRAAFESRIAAAKPLSEFLFDTLREQCDLGSEEGRARVVELARPLLSQIPEGAFRQLMINRVARIGGMTPAQVNDLLAHPQAPVMAARRPVRVGTPTAPSPVRLAITALLHQPSLAQRVDNPRKWEKLMMPGVKLLTDVLELLKDKPHMTMAGLLEQWRGTEEGRHLSKLAARQLPITEDGLAQEFEGALGVLDAHLHRQSDLTEGVRSSSELTQAQKEHVLRQHRIWSLEPKERARTISDDERAELQRLRDEHFRAEK